MCLGRPGTHNPQARRDCDAASSSSKNVDNANLVYKQGNISAFLHPRSIAVSALPVAEDERTRLKQWFSWADFHPTGFYLNPNQTLTVRVSGLNTSGPKPQIVVGTPALVHPEDHTQGMPASLQASKPLNNGDNSVSDPLGGIMYIRYTFKKGQNPPPPVNVTIGEGDAAQPFPLFRDGVTTNSQWATMLRVTNVPFAELVGERVIVTGLAKSAKVYADKSQDQSELLATYKNMISAQDSISGLSLNATDLNKPSILRPMVVQTKNSSNPNSSSFRAAIPDPEDMWWKPQLQKSWMVYHELGHQRQHRDTWSWGSLSEVTVNIYSLAARRLVPDIPSKEITHGTTQEWDAAKKYLAQGPEQKDFEKAEAFVRLVMFEQLRVLFGDAFYHQLHTNSRMGQKQDNDADRKHYFMTQSAEISKKNLTDFFTKWGLKPEERTVKEMSKQQNPTEDLTTRPVYQDKN